MQRRSLVLVFALALSPACTCAPPPTSEAQLPAAAAPDETWVLLVHGAGDGPNRWATGLAEQLRSRTVDPAHTVFIVYDWSKAAHDRLHGAENALREGAAIAQVLTQHPPRHVHVIAHSAGAFAAHAIEEALATQPTRPTLHLTFLDPYLARGLDADWGRARFGQHADFADCYLNLGDHIPTTDTPLTHAWCLDVTPDKPPGESWTGFQAHWWPTAAYPLVTPGFTVSLEATGHFQPDELTKEFPAGTWKTGR